MANPMADNTVSKRIPLPDRERCRTENREGFVHLARCLVQDPSGCEYVLHFDSGVYCYHPDRRTFEKADSP